MTDKIQADPAAQAAAPSAAVDQPSSAMVSTAPGLNPLEEGISRLNSFNTFLDVIYAAVIGYFLLRIAEHLRPIFHDHQMVVDHLRSLFNRTLLQKDVEVFLNNQYNVERVEWFPRALWLEFFVLNFAVGRYIEGRIATTGYPYRGRSRFVIDLMTALAFLVTFTAGEELSILMLASLAVVFGLLAAWAYGLFREYGRASYPRPQAAVYLHTASMVLCIGFLYVNLRQGHVDFSARGIVYLWAAYGAWLVALLIVKRLWLKEAKILDLVGVSLLELLAEWIVDKCVIAGSGMKAFARGD